MAVTYTLALCQFSSSEDRDESFERAALFVRKSAHAGARVIAMPEMWNCPYGNEYFPKYAEEEGGPSFTFMSGLAREHEIYLVGGSVPESADGNYYNTSFVFGPDGGLIGKHRKVHLFDIYVAGGPSFRESDTLSPGAGLTVADTEFGKIGIAICFDVRFAEMFSALAAKGCHLVVLPAAFTFATGAAHWELLIRSRALDNQFYVAACAPARSDTSKFRSWAHSLVADPWGDVRGAAAAEETAVFAEIDLGYLDKVRRELPVSDRKNIRTER
jgi:omega-amidase